MICRIEGLLKKKFEKRINFFDNIVNNYLRISFKRYSKEATTCQRTSTSRSHDNELQIFSYHFSKFIHWYTRPRYGIHSRGNIHAFPCHAITTVGKHP